jgi:hypothetical protein
MPGHAKDIQYRPRKWLWAYRVPFGEITLIEGHPDTNKSSVEIDISARLSWGAVMFRQDEEVDEEDRTAPAEGDSVFLTEDAIDNTFVERIAAAGGLTERFHWFKPGEVVLPGDWPEVQRMIEDTESKLLVIDPLADFIKSKNLAYGVREALQPVIDYAHQTGLAVIISRHLNRGHSRQAVYRGTGSHEVASVASSILLTAPAPNDPDLRVLFQWRHKFRPCPPLLYEVVPVRVYLDIINQPGGAASIQILWKGAVDVTEEELLGPPAQSRVKQVMGFLLRALEHGPRPKRDIMNMAQALRYGWKTVEQAREMLGIRSVRQGRAGPGAVYCWQLPTELPEAAAELQEELDEREEPE